MTRFRLVGLDVDGTLTDNQDNVRPRVREAVAACLATGVEVVLATGRGVATARFFLEHKLGFDLGVVLHNGAYLARAASQPPFVRRYLEPELAVEAAEAALAAGLSVGLYDDEEHGNRIYTSAIADLPPAMRRIHAARLVEQDVTQPLDHGLLIVTSFGDSAVVRRVAAELAAQLDGRAAVQPLHHPLYDTWTLDVAAPGCTKWTGLQTYARHIGAGDDQILAIGDGLNDIPMVRDAGWGVAMGNAGPELRAVADEVVADNEHDGCAEALERHVLELVREDR